MDCDDPDLEAFEPTLCAIVQVRVLDKTATLVSNLCQNASDPQSVGIPWKSWCTSSHGQSDYDSDTGVPQNWSLKGISTLLLSVGQ